MTVMSPLVVRPSLWLWGRSEYDVGRDARIGVLLGALTVAREQRGEAAGLSRRRGRGPVRAA